MRLKKQEGDTIVEVLFAITVFAMVAVGSLAIMNQGIATTQRSLEITLVRQQIDAQAEAIRYIHQAYVGSFQRDSTVTTGVAAEWKKLTDKSTGKGANNPSAFGTNGGACPDAAPGEKPFLLNARTARLWGTTPPMVPVAGASAPPYAQVIYNPDLTSINTAYGLWVEAVPSNTTDGPGFVDFHIRACWDSVGSSVPVTLGTIVRLYEPR